MRVAEESGDFVLTVRDDGCGYDPDAPDTGGYGLRSITYRAETMGASLATDTKKGDGTTVTLKVPPQGPAPVRQGRSDVRPRSTP